MSAEKCESKIAYTSKRMARYAADRAFARLHHPVAVYLCRYCGWYHIGRKNKGHVYHSENAPANGDQK